MDPLELTNQLKILWNELEEKSLELDELKLVYLIEEYPKKYVYPTGKLHTVTYFVPCLDPPQCIKLGTTMIKIIWMNKPKDHLILKILPPTVNRLEYGLTKQYSVGLKVGYISVYDIQNRT